MWIRTLLIPSFTFEQFKSTLEETHIDPTFQDNVLLVSDFPKHIYHVGSSHGLHSIIRISKQLLRYGPGLTSIHSRW